MIQFYEYALNLVCAPYAQNFFLHIFLGRVPPSFQGIEPSTCPSWIAQEYVMPHGAGYGYGFGGLQEDITVMANNMNLEHTLPPGQAANNVPLVERDRLPANFLQNAVRSSIPLTRHLTEHLPHPSVPHRRLSPSKVCPYLGKNLHWRAFSMAAGSRDEIPIEDIPIRVWVTQTEVTEVRGGHRTRGTPEIVWDATRDKPGGLQKGELPQVEPKTT